MTETRNPLVGPRLAHTDRRFGPVQAARQIRRCLDRDDCGLLETWLADALAADVAEAFAHLKTAQAARALQLIAPPSAPSCSATCRCRHSRTLSPSCRARR